MKERDKIITELKNGLSQPTFELFNCLYEILNSYQNKGQQNIKYELEKDYVLIILTFNEKLKLSFSFFSGYCDFFIDDNYEVFIQYKFKSVGKASDYFRKSLFSKIRKVEYNNSTKKKIGVEYWLIEKDDKRLLCGEMPIFSIIKKPKNELVKTFEPFLSLETSTNIG
ncbi:hypothetical protein [Altibacter lentus]|uniref:hypothetical protein n=1 Tax=Altibacter lentus TaxID=1223410 RepID=UPI0012685C05|nr:hypothetical protein [Altibacter lentus]